MEKFKKLISLQNAIIVLLIVFIAYTKGPQLFRNAKLEGSQLEQNLEFSEINGSGLKPEPPYALVFWATWCGPCDVELGRIHKLIQEGQLNPQKVIAISVDETLEPVRKAILDRKYSFPIVWDSSRNFSSYFEVSGTPTVVIVGKQNTIEWVATGVSPTLEIRLKKYIQ